MIYGESIGAAAVVGPMLWVQALVFCFYPWIIVWSYYYELNENMKDPEEKLPCPTQEEWSTDHHKGECLARLQENGLTASGTSPNLIDQFQRQFTITEY